MKIATLSLALLTTGLLAWAAGSASAAPVRIMCIGDSITAGSTDAPYWSVPFTFGYRGPLYTDLTTAGYDFQFVGSSGEPWNYPWGVDFGPDPAAIPIQGPDLRALGQDNHRGYSGASTSNILYGDLDGLGTGHNTIPDIATMLNADDPDIVLLMIGTNDSSASTASANISSIVSNIVTTKPDAHLIVAQITPRGTWPSAKVIDYNNYIKNVLMPNYSNDQYNVTMVDQYSGFLNANGSVNTSLLIDDYLVHMQPAGNELLAQVWFDGIQSVLSAPQPVPVPVSWTGAGSTMWSTATGLNNWKNSGGTPANFINGAPVTFSDTATGTTVDISAVDVLPTGVAFNNSSKNFTITGSKGIAGATGVVKQGTAMVTLNSANTYTGVTTVEDGTLRLGTAAQSPVLTGAGGTDLQGGKIWFDYATSSPATTIASLLAASYHDGAWDVGQFKNTTAETTGLSLGWIDNTTGKKVIVMATRAGDADLSGTIDVSDLTLLLNNYNKPGMVWSNGDFNYDGAVNVADLTALLNNYNKTIGLSMGVLVPEPTALSLLTGFGLMLAAWACRRIRHQK